MDVISNTTIRRFRRVVLYLQKIGQPHHSETKSESSNIKNCQKNCQKNHPKKSFLKITKVETLQNRKITKVIYNSVQCTVPIMHIYSLIQLTIYPCTKLQDLCYSNHIGKKMINNFRGVGLVRANFCYQRVHLIQLKVN